MNTAEDPTAVICVQNKGNEVSLQLWKIYKPLLDRDARSEGFLRVIDESGEDYLFPEENFVPIELPTEVKRPFERAVRAQRRSAGHAVPGCQNDRMWPTEAAASARAAGSAPAQAEPTLLHDVKRPSWARDTCHLLKVDGRPADRLPRSIHIDVQVRARLDRPSTSVT